MSGNNLFIVFEILDQSKSLIRWGRASEPNNKFGLPGVYFLSFSFSWICLFNRFIAICKCALFYHWNFSPKVLIFTKWWMFSPPYIPFKSHNCSWKAEWSFFTQKGYTLCRMLHGTTINIKLIFSVPQTAPSIGRANYLNSEQNQARLDQWRG